MSLVSQALVSDGPDVMGRLSNRWVLSMTLNFPFTAYYVGSPHKSEEIILHGNALTSKLLEHYLDFQCFTFVMHNVTKLMGDHRYGPAGGHTNVHAMRYRTLY